MPEAFCLVNSDHGPMLVNRFDYHGDNGVSKQILDHGNYDPGEVGTLKYLLKLARKHNGDGVVALDGGANIGVHSVEWARLMKEWGSVLAIEAQERIFYALAGNLTLQNCFNARAVLGAIGDICGNLSFPEPDYTKPGSFGSFELRPGSSPEFLGQPVDYTRPTLTVRQFTLDSLELPRVDLIKLDLEGMEQAALDGADETIKRCKPVMCVEIIKSDKAAIIAWLKNRGYRLLELGMNVIAVHGDSGVLQDL